MKILIVDDEPSVLESLTQTLESFGHQVASFTSAEEVFNAAPENLRHSRAAVIDGLYGKAISVEDWILEWSPHCHTVCFSTERIEGFRGEFVRKPYVVELVTALNKLSS